MTSIELSFTDLGLVEELLRSIADAGFEAPTPIQSRTIPVMLAGHDVIGQAQTGTGKTAAFALPMLQALDPNRAVVQGLVLAPTRELALQVAEAVHSLGKHLGGVRVMPIYGGQPIGLQFNRLRRGVHIVVGTPGRVLDHLQRGTLDLSAVRTVVLDEADEMLRMGFIDDVETILSATPPQRLTALFSATMPPEIRRIAKKHLREPVTVDVIPDVLTLPEIEQRYLVVPESQKVEALARLLETEPFDAVLVFTRTRIGCAEVADQLQSRGHAAEPLHGDMNQRQRERVMELLRAGKADIVVATDVAARGLDVDRISHVVNLDLPNGVEAYVHRIGRTGRAGRSGRSLLFLAPRERRFLALIERTTGQSIAPMEVPTRNEVFAQRVEAFKLQLSEAAVSGDLEIYRTLVEELSLEGGFEMVEIAAAAARLARGDQPLVAPPPEAPPEPARRSGHPADEERVRLVFAVGYKDGVRPGNIVGALANEGGVPGPAVGAIDVHQDHCFVDIPGSFLNQVLHRMSDTWIRRRPARIRVVPMEDRQPRRKEKRRQG